MTLLTGLPGMAIGPGRPQALQDPAIERVGSIGLLYIIFIAGAELDLDLVRERKQDAIFGAMAFVFSFFPAFGDPVRA